jgi:hypothetical protein
MNVRVYTVQTHPNGYPEIVESVSTPDDYEEVGRTTVPIKNATRDQVDVLSQLINDAYRNGIRDTREAHNLKT